LPACNNRTCATCRLPHCCLPTPKIAQHHKHVEQYLTIAILSVDMWRNKLYCSIVCMLEAIAYTSQSCFVFWMKLFAAQYMSCG
jgi:hypothetical protein